MLKYIKKIKNLFKSAKDSKTGFAIVPALIGMGAAGLIVSYLGNKWIQDQVATALAYINYIFASAFAYLFVIVVDMLVKVASFSNIINIPVVVYGWVIIRDICNMFFIIALLVIAFATILRIESYGAKRLLPKLLIMAVLINFSRTIFGLIIDVSQVFMLTFVAAFAEGGGHFVDAFMIKEMFEINKGGSGTKAAQEAIDKMGGIHAMVISLLMVIFAMGLALIVVTVLLATLVARVAMLWIYTILSPLVFLGFAFPPIGNYTRQIWSSFIKQVIVGPVLAFFIWLALLYSSANFENPFSSPTEIAGTNNICAGASAVFCSASFQKYVIVIAMLMGGLMVTQQMGGAAANLANRGLGAARGMRNIGVKGLRKFSGYNYVADTGKAYFSMRKADKANNAMLRAGKIKETVGNVQSTIGTTVSNTANKLNPAFWFGKKANRLDKEVAEEQQKIDDVRNADWYKNKTEHTEGDKKYKYKKIGNNGIWQEIQIEPGGTDHVIGNYEHGKLEEHLAGTNDAELEKKRKSAEKWRKAQELSNKAAKWGLAGLGFGAGLALGGGGLFGLIPGIYGAAVLGGGLPAAAKAVRNAGKENLALASNVTSSQVSKAQDGMKHDSNEEILANLSDNSLDKFTRMAVVLEAMNRRLLNLSDAKRWKSWIKQATGGESKTGGFKDKKMGARVEASMEKNYVGATKLFENLQPGKTLAPGSDEHKRRQTAERDIGERFKDGSFPLKDLDIGSLKDSAHIWADVLKSTTFKSNFDASNDTKQLQILDILKEEQSFGSKDKLASVKDIQTALDSFTDKARGAQWQKEFTMKLTFNDIQETLNKGSSAKVESLIKAIGKDVDNLSESVKRRLNNSNDKIAESIRTVLEIPKTP